MAAYQNTLAIAHGGKGIPYGGGGPRPDGSENHGFKNLKSDPSLVAAVPELAADPALMAMVWAINQADTGLLSVGCGSYDIDEAQGRRRTGYIEFAYNSKTGVLDASHYFPLFFHFDSLLHANQFAEVFGYAWVLEGVTFIEAGVSGFTATIYLNTGFFGSKEEAQACWDQALGPLTAYLGGVPIQPGEPIYAPEIE